MLLLLLLLLIQDVLVLLSFSSLTHLFAGRAGQSTHNLHKRFKPQSKSLSLPQSPSQSPTSSQLSPSIKKNPPRSSRQRSGSSSSSGYSYQLQVVVVQLLQLPLLHDERLR